MSYLIYWNIYGIYFSLEFRPWQHSESIDVTSGSCCVQYSHVAVDRLARGARQEG